MIPIPFAEQNKRFGPPPGKTEDDVKTLCVHDRKESECGDPECLVHITHHFTSCWVASDEERMEFISTGKLYITIHGNFHPVISCSPIKPDME